MNQLAPNPAPRPTANRFPPQIKFIVGNEACERLSYYGMLSILTLYMKNALGMAPEEAKGTVHLFKMAVYFLPLFGGWLADRWLGRYWTILSISLFYCLGHGVLALWEGSLAGLYTGLLLIAIGAGGIKPCVSAFVGDQFGPEQQSLLPKVYGLFYWSINLGAFIAFAGIPLVRDHLSYSWAFGVPGIFMALATLVFWIGTPHYARQPAARETKQSGFLPVVWTALTHSSGRRAGESWLDAARARHSPAEVNAAKAVVRITVIFAAVPVFWALFDQINTTWVLQGEKMTSFAVLGYKVDAERIQSVSALLVLAWIPVLTLGVYPLCERLGLRPTPLRRMGAGMVLGAVAFVLCGWIQSRMDQGHTLSLAWQIIPYVFLEAGEVMLSATGLEFAFSQAPASMKSTIMSLWLMTVAVGNLLVASFTKLNQDLVKASGATEFYFYALLMFVVAGVFALLALRYREPGRQSGDFKTR
ncbi:MAG: POT family MFS transporter [Verrucomicrobia bacterium]|nr:POT family MFS transporter [Verrucomicrobiota bacterium]